HPAPVLDRIVVSLMGEQWSPQTAPASTAPKAGSSSSGPPSTVFMICPAIGSRIPKEPHEVPVEKAIAPASTNMTGISQDGGSEVCSTRLPRYSPVPSSAISDPSIQ